MSLASQITLAMQAIGAAVKSDRARLTTLETPATLTEVTTGTSTTKYITPSSVVSAVSVTKLAKVQFIPNGGTVSGSPGAYTLIIEQSA